MTSGVRSDPDAAEVDFEIGEQHGPHPGGAFVRADEPVSRALELVDLEDASLRIHDPVLADAVASVERGLGNAIPQNGPGREDLDDKIRRTLDRAGA